ncbi:hypothetical protein, partial [Arthrobacter globiformis]|uniref:hypothetical protein n=1 Tax=Arthrobacter globiformis TaxID=1665 RepID=UPI0027884C15
MQTTILDPILHRAAIVIQISAASRSSPPESASDEPGEIKHLGQPKVRPSGLISPRTGTGPAPEVAITLRSRNSGSPSLQRRLQANAAKLTEFVKLAMLAKVARPSGTFIARRGT